MRIVIAPDKFKGSLSADSAAEAIAAGIGKRFPGAEIICAPVADGGEGTVQAIVGARGGRFDDVEVQGPVGDPVRAGIGWLDDGGAVIEVSSAAGLAHLSSLEPLRASSDGCGELIARVLEAGRHASLVVGVGGSASTDGGTGAATAVGWRFLDGWGRDLERGGGALHRLASIDGERLHPALASAQIVGAVDVDNPLVGPRGSAHVFAPQKGATEDDVALLEEGLSTLAMRIEADIGIAVADLAGGGGAGGIGAGLVAFFGADLRPGFEVVAEAIGLRRLLSAADLVVTGEGKLDAGSLGGKAPVGVAREAAAAGVPCMAVAGEVTLTSRDARAAGFHATVSLSELYGRDHAMTRTAELLYSATAAAFDAIDFL
ncbi:MAG: glycerate kinase [Actinomycetota bacterium]